MNYTFSIVGFTVLMQLAAGLALMACLCGIKNDPAAERRLWLVAFCAGLAAMISSMFHLHDFWHAPYTITQLGHAWMSREILFAGIFMLFVFLRVLNTMKGSLNFLPKFLCGFGPRMNWLAAVAGIVLVVVMAQIYSGNRSMPLWNNAGSLISFVASMLLLGGFSALAIVAGSEVQPEAKSRAGRVGASTAAIGAAFAFVMPSYWLPIIYRNAMDAEYTDIFVSAAPCFVLTQAVLLAVAGIFAVVSWNKCSKGVWLAVLFATAATLVARSLYYAGQIKIGIMVM